MSGGEPERTLRARRTDPDAARFDPAFYEKDELFWPIAAAAAAFRDFTDWPPVEEYARAFDQTVAAPISFELSVPKPRRWRRKEAVDVRTLYDGRITLAQRVPTRARSWHDFLNALVWASFPEAKAALHARQHAAMSTHVALSPDANRLPNARTRELDALALIDEGGVIMVAPSNSRFIFGHALYEGLVLGSRSMIARSLALPMPAPIEMQNASLSAIDAALASLLRNASPLVPEVLPRIAITSLRDS